MSTCTHRLPDSDVFVDNSTLMDLLSVCFTFRRLRNSVPMLLIADVIYMFGSDVSPSFYLALLVMALSSTMG